MSTLEEQLKAMLTQLLQGDETLASFLAIDDNASKALLTLGAAGLRLTDPRHTGSVSNCTFEVARAAVQIYGALLAHLATGTTSDAAICATARSVELLRVQLLHCCSRHAASAPSSASEAPSFASTDGHAREAAEGQADVVGMVGMSMSLLRPLVALISALLAAPKGSAGEPPLPPLTQTFICELAAALKDSHLLEHTAHALLSAAADPARQPLSPPEQSEYNRNAWALAAFAEAVCALATVLRPLGCADAAGGLAAAVSGPCVRHLAATAGVVALCEADGGPDYGLPRELRQRVGAPALMADPLPHSLPQLHSSAVVAVISALRLALLGARHGSSQPPRRRAALALALRTARLAVASGQAWAAREAAPQRQPRPQSQQVPPPAAQVAAGDDGAAATEQRSAAPPASASAPGEALAYRAVLGRDMVGFAAVDALECADVLLWDLEPGRTGAAPSAAVGHGGGGGGARGGEGPEQEEERDREGEQERAEERGRSRVAAGHVHGQEATDPAAEAGRGAGALPAPSTPDEVEFWRLLAAATQDVTRVADQGMLRRLAHVLSTASARLRPGAEEMLSEAPSRHVSAALAGGLVPCLERLMRRMGEDPLGPEAAMVSELLAAKAFDWTVLVPLLAHGEQRQAAALLATMQKLNRRGAEISVVLMRRMALSGSAVHGGDLMLMLTALSADLLQAVPSLLTTAAAVLGGADPGQPQWLACLQLAQVLTRFAVMELPMQAPRALTAMRSARGLVGYKSYTLFCQSVVCWVPWLARLGMPTGAASGPSGHEHQEAPAAAAGHSAPGRPSAVTSACNARGTAALLHLGSAEAAAVAQPRWRSPLLEQVDAVRLMGTVLGSRDDLRTDPAFAEEHSLPLASACAALVAACPDDVRREVVVAAAAAAAQPAAGAQGPRGGGGSKGPSRRWRDGGSSAAPGDGRRGGPLRPWHPELIRSLAADIVAAGYEKDAADTEVLADLLERWVRAGEASFSSEERAAVWRLAFGRVSEGACRLMAAAAADDAAAPPLRRCGNPLCVSLAGDSEAELRLTACVGCGEVAYCCRECWSAHWQAGHKQLCSRRLQGGRGK